MLMRGLSPVAHEVLSGYDGFDIQEQTMMYSPNNFVEGFCDNNSSVSPHSIRQNRDM